MDLKFKKKTPTAFTNIEWKFFINYYKLDKKKTNARCVGCGKCQDYCSVHNIKLTEDGKVEFGSNCQYCFACIQRCQKMAIEFGKICVSNPKRYIHPIFVDATEFKYL